MKGPRGACLIISAPPGDRRAAKGLIGRVIRETLGVKKWYTPPFYVSYMSEAEVRSEGGRDARFYIEELSDKEFQDLMSAISTAAKAEGWHGSPVDAYHD